MGIAMMITILHGFIYLLILPSLLFTASLIICGNSRAQQKPMGETRSSQEHTMNDSNRIRNLKVKRSLSRTKSAESTESVKSQKSLKLTRSKSKAKRAKKSLKQLKALPVTKSMDKSELKRSSRFQRFPKQSAMHNISSFQCVDRSISRTIDEEIQEGMKMEPKSLNWNISGGVQRVYLTNPSNERRAIKVKCSDNLLYRVSHVFGIVEPGQILTIDVVRQNGGAKTDKMIFLWTKAEKTDENASMLFNKLSVYPVLVLPLTVNNPTE